MIKKTMIFLAIIGLLTVFPAWADDDAGEKENDVKIKLKVGAKVEGEQDFQGKVKEYSPIDKGVKPIVKAKIKGRANKTYFNLFSDFRGHMKNQHHELGVDVNRVFKQELSYDALYHRLDHDPLTNMDVVSHARSATYADDFNPDDQYHITRHELISRTRISVPSLPFLKIYVDYRDEQRKGQYQARTLSHCSACHVVAKSRSLDSSNRDFRLGGIVRMGKSVLDYSFTQNKFKDQGAVPTNQYLLVQHPEKKVPVFNARIGYNNDEEAPFDFIPESRKNTHVVKAAVPVSQAATITAQYVNSTVKNHTSGLEWTSNSFAGSFSTRLGKRGMFNIRLQHIKIENDSIFIDIMEPVDVAGPKAGMTYGEAYGAVFDFTRYSALSRTVWDISANLRYRLSKPLRVKLGYRFKKVDREFYDVDDTQTHTFKAAFKYRPVKQVKFNLEGMVQSAKDPFANVKAAVAPAQQTTAYTNPFVGVQFFQWHMDRRATLTNYPESVYQVKGGFNWSPSASFALNGNVLYRTEENDNLELSGASWNRDMTQWGINMWAAPSPKMPITASYYCYQNKYDSLFAIAALEGCGAGIVGGMTGTLTDMMGYDIDTQTVMVNVHYSASKSLSFFCGLNYNKSTSELNELALDTSQLDYIPGSGATALDFDDFGGVAEYSKLDMKQMIAELGFNYSLSKQWKLNGTFYYYLYDDMAQYLYTDTSGKSYSFFAGFTWASK